MARQDEAEATIRILGEDLVTGAAQNAERSVERIGETAEKVAKGPFGRLSDALDALGENTFFTELNQASELAGKALGVLASGYEQLKQAAADRTIANTFNRAFGADGLERLAAATQGLIADTGLRELANQGARAGLSLEQVASLLESSTRAALGSGKDLRETADGFLKSTIEGNDEATKQLGILVDLGSAQDDYARSLGVTTDRLTATQRAAASLTEITKQTDAAFQGVTGDGSLNRLSRLEARWQNFTATMREAALAATVGLPETIDRALEGPSDILESEAFKRLDDLVKGDFSTENIERVIMKLRLAGAVQEAYTLNIQLTARATQLLAQEEAALDAAFRERAAHMEAVAAAERARLKALADEVIKTDEARIAAIEHARQLALVAERLGSSQQAGERWQAVLVALGAAHVNATDDVMAFYGAIRSSNNEMAKAIELQAEMAAAAGDLAGADALRAQALGVMTGETGSTKPSVAKSGGGGKSKLDASLEENARRTAEGQQRLNDAMWALRDQAEQLADEQHQMALQADEARFRERVDLALAHHEEQQRFLSESRQSGFDSLTDSILGLRDALGELDGISLDGLANAAQNMGPLMAQFDALANATDKSKGAMISGSLGIVAASGKMVAGIIKDQRAQAIIMSLVEQAEAWGAFARYDYVSFGAHMVSSALWGAIAGTSGGGGGRGGGGASGGAGGRGARETPRVPNEAPPDGPTFNPITIHISGGTYLGTDAERTGRELARMVDRHRGRSFRSGDGGSPP
jgi:hypothetical protein